MRHDTGGKLAFAGCALGGEMLGLIPAQFKGLDDSDPSNIILAINLCGLTFALIKAMSCVIGAADMRP
ncbi:MAG: hypothetical protein G9473_06475 [Erythrobacter sp.]|nr:MAG: hypothetical protein G9473_06475 [Erythrobacter sp.]